MNFAAKKHENNERNSLAHPPIPLRAFNLAPNALQNSVGTICNVGGCAKYLRRRLVQSPSEVIRAK